MRIALPLVILLGGCVATAIEVAANYDKNEAVIDFKSPRDDIWKSVLTELRKIDVDTSKAPPAGPTHSSFSFRDGYVKMEPHKSYPKYTRVRLKYKDMKGENKDRARRILDRAAHRLGDDAAYPEVDK
ncbi:MAG: hypothetical protein ACYTGK_14255 [Planctomycetota bacterium]|jgi:hypothetical protein